VFSRIPEYESTPLRAIQKSISAADIGKKTVKTEKTTETVRTVKADKKMKTGTGYAPDGKNRVKKAIPSNGTDETGAPDTSDQGESTFERMTPEAGEDDFDEETDTEAAAICLNCRRKRCLLDDNLPCRRYHREMRILLARRQSESAGS
jgi:hypothetical protein